MAKKLFEADNEIYRLMKALVSEIEDHNQLIDVVDEIAIVMKAVRPPKNDPHAVVMTGKTAKAPAVLEALGRSDYKYVITLNSTEWALYTPEQKRAQMDHCLCAMRVKENPKTGEMVYGTRKPEIIGYAGEFKRNGFWRERPGGGTFESPIENMFSVDEDGEGNEASDGDQPQGDNRE